MPITIGFAVHDPSLSIVSKTFKIFSELSEQFLSALKIYCFTALYKAIVALHPSSSWHSSFRKHIFFCSGENC
jgi:hypothetical protein